MTTTKDRSTDTGKKPPATKKTSLYRLRCNGSAAEEELTAFVMPGYLNRDDFTSTPVDNRGVRGLLVTGTIAPGGAAWCGSLSALTGIDIAEENRTASGLLLVRTGKHVYALSYGMGFQMINPSRIDPGFGIEFAVRCLDPDYVTKIRRQIMDARGRSDENSVTSGESIRGFGIEQFGEIVSQIAGKIEKVPLTFTKGGKRKAHVTGNDRNLTLHLAITPEGLMEDLRCIEGVCERPDPLPALSFITQVRPLIPKSDQVARLDERLDDLLGEDEVNRVALTVPGECRDQFESAESFAVTLAGDMMLYDEIDVSDLLAAVKDEPKGSRLQALRAGRVQMFADVEGDHPLSRRVPAHEWLTAEITEETAHYFLWQGQWYEIGAEYLATVEARVADILSGLATVTLPPWTAGVKVNGKDSHDEDWYNREIAKQDGYVLLDKKTVVTEFFRGGGLEIADALGPEGQLVCVKKADKSTAPLNHLFAQGLLAVETLRQDRNVRKKFLAKLRGLAPDCSVDTLSDAPVVVFGIMLKNGVPITTDTLFAFAKISLLHTATMLENMGAKLEVVSIYRTRPSGTAEH